MARGTLLVMTGKPENDSGMRVVPCGVGIGRDALGWGPTRRSWEIVIGKRR